VPGPIAFDGSRTGRKRPIGRLRKGKRTDLGFQSDEHIGMKMDRPIVLNDPEALCLEGSLADLALRACFAVQRRESMSYTSRHEQDISK
jgi:hypothetical protein